MTLPYDKDWRAVRWPIALETPPEVVHTGLGIHGLNGDERYLLRDLWCLHLYPYEATLRVGPHCLPIRPGYAGIIPPNVPVEYVYHERVQHLFVHFRCAVPLPDANGTQVPAM